MTLAGIGTLYRCEVLFLAGISPFAPVQTVTDLRMLTARARSLLEANKARPEQTTTGDVRRGHRTWVHQRAGRPCLRCGTPVLDDVQGDPMRARQVFWCPSCQPRPGAGAVSK
ncbi:MAG: hypothetical protein ACRDOJ_02885 [Nocardioidaceae bacterium]